MKIYTGWGGHLFRRFCKLFSESSPDCWAVLQLPCCPSKRGELLEMFCNMFSKSSPCLLGQHGSCSTAQQPGNSQKTYYKTFGTSVRPTQYMPQPQLNVNAHPDAHAKTVSHMEQRPEFGTMTDPSKYLSPLQRGEGMRNSGSIT